MNYVTSVFALMVSSAGVCLGNSSEKPNILWLTSEDNNVTYLGCYGNEMANTPNLDKLAGQGFRYTHCYSNGAVCSASRSTWITGMLSPSTGLHNHRSSMIIPEAVTLYPRALQKAGYYTVNTGKMDYNIKNYDKTTWGEGGKKLDWAKLKQRQPFFQVINTTDSHESRAMGTDHVHDSSKVKIPPYHPDIAGVRDNYAHYYDAVTRMDAKIGGYLKALDKAGLSENTIVIYNSDHGGPLPRGKRYMYNSGTHCPLIVRIPEKFKQIWPVEQPGTTVDRMVSFIDMPATWISLAGGEIPKNYHGRVFLGQGKTAEPQYHVSFRGRNDEKVENARAIRDKRFLYVKNYIPYVPRGQYLEYQWKIPMQRFWEEHYKAGNADAHQSRFFQTKPDHELYDTGKDPYCLTNLADNPEFKQVVKKMKGKLAEQQRRVYDAAFLPESELSRLASDNKLTVYEVLRNKSLYNIELYQQAADLALEDSCSNIAALRANCSHNELGVRYWAAVGLMMCGKEARVAQTELQNLLKDSSDNVRLMAAWALIKIGEKEPAYAAIRKMLAGNSYAMLEILNVISWMEADGKPLLPAVSSLNGLSKLPAQVKRYLLEGQLPLKSKTAGKAKGGKKKKAK